MSIIPVPDHYAESIFELDAQFFISRGISLVMLDVDNTIAPYGSVSVSGALVDWAKKIKSAGLSLHILSNSRSQRPSVFAEALEIDFNNMSWKPFTKTIKAVLSRYGVMPQNAALIGDQIYTDVLCAKLSGVFAVLVKPIDLGNVALRVRYALEVPFRSAYKRRESK